MECGSSTFRPTTILNNVSDDTSPSLGGNLSTGSNNITGSGNIDLQGGGSKLKFNFANSSSFLIQQLIQVCLQLLKTLTICLCNDFRLDYFIIRKR